jgi:hypothetical protein
MEARTLGLPSSPPGGNYNPTPGLWPFMVRSASRQTLPNKFFGLPRPLPLGHPFAFVLQNMRVLCPVNYSFGSGSSALVWINLFRLSGEIGRLFLGLTRSATVSRRLGGKKEPSQTNLSSQRYRRGQGPGRRGAGWCV